MKKIVIVALSLCLGISAFSQDIENATTLLFNISRPTVDDCIPYTNDDIHGNKLLMDNPLRLGGSISVGGLYYFNAIDFADGLRFGLGTDYFDFQVHYLRGSVATYATYEEKFNDLRVRLNPKFGPLISYSPVDIMKIDLQFRWAPMVGVWYYNNEEYLSRSWSSSLYDMETINHVAVDWGLARFSLGFSYRISVVMIGVEYLFGTSKTKYVPYGSSSSGNVQDLTYRDNYLRLSIGFHFE